ncbi:MAG: metallopeptidase family protein [Dehalococcoidales bacterium]
MDREKFEWLVAKVVENLPNEFRTKLENIDLVVENQPTPSQLAEAGLKRAETLLGLYEGVPLTKRSRHYGMVVPDKITIFQKPIEARCKNDAEVKAEIMRVVQHEIAHHFGIGDTRLRQLAKGKNQLFG